MDPNLPSHQPTQTLHQEEAPHDENQHLGHPHHVSNKPIVVSLFILAIVLIVGIYYFTIHPRTPITDTIQDQARLSVTPVQTVDVTWEFNGEEWKPTANPVTCEEPLVLESPVDVNLVSGILYPGQVRGEDYKPHGGYAFAGRANEEILVRAPMDAKLVSGSRYLEQGETQYLLFFVNPCGIAYRFDHLLTLTPEIQKLADTLPQPAENDSRTMNFASPSAIKKGDPIATAVGFKNTQNVTVDFGVYDLRKQNPRASDAAFAYFHRDEKDQAYYSLCWLDLFQPDIVAKLKALPGVDPLVGKASDFCNS